MTLHLTVPDSAWEVNDIDPGRMIVTLRVNNRLSMHLEAWEYDEHADSDDMDLFYRAVGAEGNFTLMPIFGTSWVILASPFCT